jgi:hypothetical protein
MPPVDEPRDSFTYLILNPAAGGTAALLASLTRAARALRRWLSPPAGSR